ncbi:MAG: hypothetical protein RL120_03090 [Gammaproteobacteria bacterium]
MTPESIPTVNVTEVFDRAELHALAARIEASGVLGRSRYYSALLSYLVRCSIERRSPKEVEIAVEALGKADSFDVGTDSSVRVYVHQLRKKLDSYYKEHEQEAAYRIVIPKGSYSISAVANQINPKRMDGSRSEGVRNRFGLHTVLILVAIGLPVANLVYITRSPPPNQNLVTVREAAHHPVWTPVLNDDKPILLVRGDYYIFGELNANGNVARMVREFNVNSPTDLEELRFSDIQRAENYLDLDLSYMPEGSAFALTRIVPILEESGKPVNITMMSDLTTADIRSNHIVYIGYISALEKLTDMTFAGSGLRIGRSYDELFNTRTAEYFTSDAGLPEEGAQFRDYGFFSSFPASLDTHVVLIAGMRDAGLMHTAQALANADSLDDLVISIDTDTDEAVASFEALDEVFGMNRMNFDANLVYTGQLDVNKIWRAPQNPILQ